MADDMKDRRLSGQTAEPVASATAAPGDSGKRPYATLDLKATEIKITAVPNNSQSYAYSAARGSTVSKSETSYDADKTPGPAPASTYATAAYATAPKSDAAKTSATASAAASATVSAKPTASASAAASPAPKATVAPSAKSETAVVKKRGGFFSHISAGVIGGVLALAGAEWALPQLGIHGTTSRLADDTAAIGQRLQAIEKSPAADVAALELRIAGLEKSAARIPAIVEGQSRLVAETKAALAASTSESTASEQLTRIASVEDKLKALTDAGANDPNAGRLAQLAALTGKVADLETSLTTQLTAFRKGVSEDVDARIASVSASTEAAKSGTQRIDKDVATVKSEAALTAERLVSLKTDNDRLNATLKMAQDETTAIKSAVEALKAGAAKATDISAAVKPVDDKLASLEQNVQSLVKAEGDRRANSERVLLSLELQNLKRALDSGQKYAAELEAVQKVSGGKLDVAALDKFKDVGLPAASELAKDFRKTANAAIDAEVEPTEGSVVDRLIAGAKNVVRVRQVTHAPDDKSAEAVVSRMETALKDGRLAEVLTEAKQLSPKALAATQPFLDRVAARVSVESAVSAIEGQLKTSLSAAPVPPPKAAP
jgi:hypothetical protein